MSPGDVKHAEPSFGMTGQAAHSDESGTDATFGSTFRIVLTFSPPS